MQVLLVEFIPRQNMFKPDWKKNWKTPPSPLFILARLLLLQSSSQNLGNLDKICPLIVDHVTKVGNWHATRWKGFLSAKFVATKFQDCIYRFRPRLCKSAIAYLGNYWKTIFLIILRGLDMIFHWLCLAYKILLHLKLKSNIKRNSQTPVRSQHSIHSDNISRQQKSHQIY